MSDWNDRVLTRTVPKLTGVSLAERAEILAGPIGVDNHRAHFDRLVVLREIEAGGAAPRRLGIDGPARLAFWNVERLRHIDAITGTLRAVGADIDILCEIDRGMARTGNTDRIVDLASRLDLSYLYAVEFVELGLGDVDEQVDHAGEQNLWGFHGGGLLSDVELGTPFLIRIEDRGTWFDGSLHERRVGGRIAVGAKISIMGERVTVISTHVEGYADPATRGRDMGSLLERVETVAPGAPVVLAGDFNTTTAGPERWQDRSLWLEHIRQEPQRLTSPDLYEPLFAVARQFGYEWHAANVMETPTQRFPAGSLRPNHKIDWIFTRGLDASDPKIIPAVGGDGQPSSDHECLAVTIRPKTPAN